MYDENPGVIDFDSYHREVQVSESSSHRESTVILFLNKNPYYYELQCVLYTIIIFIFLLDQHELV